MGDEEFTKEELETLGEESEEEGPDTQEESEEKEEESEEEAETEQESESEEKEEEEHEAEEKEEDNLIPQSRLDKMRWEKGEIERKHELLKRNPDEYYKLYPDEKPEEEKGEEKETVKTVSKADIWNMVIEGGLYDGKTLREAHEEDPLYAIDLYNDYRDELRKEEIKKESETKRIQEESQKEVEAFSEGLSQEMYGKKVNDLTKEEGKKVDDELDAVLAWMGETGRGGGNIADAYFLMHKDKILSETQGKGIQAIIHATQSNQVSSISSKKSSDTKTGYDADVNLTREQLETKIDRMGDAEFAAYKKNAPAALKSKFPDLDWD